MGAGSQRHCQLRGSREGLDSWLSLFLHFLGEAPELEGLQEADRYGRAEMRAKDAQPYMRKTRALACPTFNPGRRVRMDREFNASEDKLGQAKRPE